MRDDDVGEYHNSMSCFWWKEGRTVIEEGKQRREEEKY